MIPSTSDILQKTERVGIWFSPSESQTERKASIWACYYAAEGKSKRRGTMQGLLELLLEIGTLSPLPTFHGRNKTLGQAWWWGKESQRGAVHHRGDSGWDLPCVQLKSVWSETSLGVISIEWRLQLSVEFSREGEKAQGPVLSFTHRGIARPGEELGNEE